MASKTTEEDLLKEIRDNRDTARRENQHNLDEAKTDLRFIAGGEGQWDEDALRDRKASGRPILTFNVLDVHCEQLVGQKRQNRSGPKISAVDESTKGTAEVIEGLIRHIEYASHADQADDNAFSYAVKCGWGAIRITAEYVDDESDEQELVVKPIHDPLALTIDPLSRDADASDALWMMLEKRMSRDEFKRTYPGAEAYTDTDISMYAGWVDEASCRVVEYWRVEYGTTKKVGKREIQDRKVKQYITNGKEILETNDWPGYWIPIIPTYGKEVYIEGRRHLQSAIRHARDAQVIVNFSQTGKAEVLALTPRVPYIGYEGQFSVNNDQWRKANSTTLAYLEVKGGAIPGTNNPYPLPQRQQFEPPVQAYEMATESAQNLIKSTIGQFDPSLGANEKDLSGKAINSLQAQGGATTFTFSDNADRSKLFRFQQFLDLIPYYYDTPRMVRILGPDMSQEIKQVNQPFVEDGKMMTYLLTEGRYEATIEVGPSYDSLRDEVADFAAVLLQKLPEQLSVIALPTLIRLKGMGPLGEKMADMFDKMLPPQLQPDSPQADLPPQVQQIVQQHGILTQQVHKLSEMIQNKVVEKQADNQAKLAQLDKQFQIEQYKASQAIELAKITQQTAILGYQATFDAAMASVNIQAQLKRDLAYTDQAHEVGMAAVEHAHNVAAQQQQHDQALEQGQVQHEQGMEQQGDAQEFTAEQSDADRQAAAEQASQSEGE